MSRRTDPRPGKAAPPLPVCARARLLPLAAVLALLLAAAPDARATVPTACTSTGTLEPFASTSSTAGSISVTFKDPMPSGYNASGAHDVRVCYEKADNTWSNQLQQTSPTKPVAGTTHTFDDIRNQSGTKVADFAAETDYYVTFGASYANLSITYHIRTKAEGADNNAPTVANQIPNQTATVGSAFSFQFADNAFNDADSGDTLTYTAAKSDDGALPAWLSFAASSRSFSGTPATTDVGTVSVKVTASDGTASISDTFDIVVSSTGNNAPTVANQIPNQAATAGTAFSYTFPANTFADADSGDTLSYSATKSDDTALPAWLSFAASSRRFSGTPATTDVGTVSVKVTASDGTASVSDTFDIVVSQGVPGPGKLAGNTGQTSNHSWPINRIFSQGFTTGGSANGYTLTLVDIATEQLSDSERETVTVNIESETRDSTNRRVPDGVSLGALAIDRYDSTSGLTRFAVPSGIDLDPNTNYWVVWRSSATGSSLSKYFVTNSDDNDSDTLAGWNIYATGFVDDTHQLQLHSLKLDLHGYGRGSLTAPPHVVTSSVVDKALALNFSWDLHPDWVPKPSQFTVKVAGRAVAVADVALSGKTVALTLAEAAGAGQAVTVSYTMAGVPIRTSIGDALGFTDKRITNNSTNNAPVFTPTASNPEDSEFVNAGGKTLASLPTDRTGFSDPDGDALTFSASLSRDDAHAEFVDQSGTSIRSIFFRSKTNCELSNLDPPVNRGDFVVATLTASDPAGATARITRRFGAGSTVANEMGDLLCPDLQSASVTDTTLTLSYRGNISERGVAVSASEFAVTVDGREVAVESAMTGTATETGNWRTTPVTLVLAEAVGLGQNVMVSHAPGDDPTTVGFTDEEVTVTSTNSAPTAHCGVDKDDNPEPCEPNDLSKNAPPGTLSNTPLAFGDVDTDTIAACDSNDPAYDESLVCSGDRKLTFTWVTGRPEVFDSAHSGYVVHFIPRFTGLYLKVLSACALRELNPPPPALFETTTTVTATDATGAVRRVTVVTQTSWSPDDCPELGLVLSGAGGGALKLVYDRALDEGSVPPASLFTVKANGTAVDLAASDAVAVEGNAVVLTLAAAVTAGQSVTVSYAPPQTGVGGIKSADSHAAGGVRGRGGDGGRDAARAAGHGRRDGAGPDADAELQRGPGPGVHGGAEPVPGGRDHRRD